MAGGNSRKVSAIVAPLKTDISPFSKGLKAAKDQAAKVTAGITSHFSIMGRGIGDSIAKVRTKFEDLGKTNLGQLAKGMAGITLAAAGTVAAVGAVGAAFATGGFKRIGALGEVSLALGIASDKLSELQFAAIASGASAEDLNGFLKGLTATVHASIGQINPASEAFHKLGTSAEELSRLSPDQQFNRLKAGFDALPDAASKANAAVAIGGEAGLKLFRLLGMSAKQFEALKEKSKSTGFTVRPEDLAKVQAFNTAWSLIGATFDGLVNKLTVAVAPGVEFVASKFTEWFQSVTKDSKFFDQLVDGLVGGFARLADMAVTVKLGFTDAFSALAVKIGEMIGWIGQLTRSISALIQHMGDVAARVTGFDDLAISLVTIAAKGRQAAGSTEALGKKVAEGGKAQAESSRKARESFEANKPSTSILTAFDSWKAKVEEVAKAQAKNTAATQAAATVNKTLQDSVTGLAQKFRDTIADSGLTAEGKQIAELRRKGASEGDVSKLSAMSGHVREAGKRDSLAEDLRESTKTPFQKLSEELARISQLQAEGKITQTQAIRGAAQKTSESGIAGGPVQFAAAAQSNSAEGRSYLLSQTIGKPESMLETAKKGLDATMQSNGFLGQIVTLLAGQGRDAALNF